MVLLRVIHNSTYEQVAHISSYEYKVRTRRLEFGRGDNTICPVKVKTDTQVVLFIVIFN